MLEMTATARCAYTGPLYCLHLMLPPLDKQALSLSRLPPQRRTRRWNDDTVMRRTLPPSTTGGACTADDRLRRTRDLGLCRLPSLPLPVRLAAESATDAALSSVTETAAVLDALSRLGRAASCCSTCVVAT